MRIVVFSDTHGDISGCYTIIENMRPDMIFHLGDTVPDAKLLASDFPDIPFTFVAGNGDFYTSYPTHKTVTVDGIKIFLCHGHEYGVSCGVSGVAQAASREGAVLALFGHIHMPVDQTEGGVRCICPGSVSHPRGSNCSCAVIEIENGKVGACIYDHWRQI